MWKRLLGAVSLVAALTFACSSESTDGANAPSDADASTTPDDGDDGGEAADASASDAAKKDAGKTDGTAPPTGSCTGMPDDTPCLDDAGFEAICCGGACVSAYDKDHCHACGEKCDDSAGEACGLKGCIGKTCKAGRTECYTAAGGIGACCGGSSCVDTQSDSANCGACGTPCAATETCMGGHCMLADCTGAPGGATCVKPGSFVGKCCGGACVDTESSATSCSMCGYGCPTGATCTGGQCKTGGTNVWCAQDGVTCPSGTSCNRPHGRCVQDACDGTSEEGFACKLDGDAVGACCGGGCKDISFDVKNCGGCGIACAAGQWCSHGYCQATVTCDATNGNAMCNLANGRAGLCCDGACVDPHTPSTCGACGSACPTGATCSADGVCRNGETVAFCTSSAQCASGSVCQAGRCAKPACTAGSSGNRCAFGRTAKNDLGTCCGGECVDLSQDKDACGACGKACPSGLCVGGACVPTPTTCGAFTCGTGYQCVEGTCVSGCNGGPFTSFCASPTGTLGACCDNFFSSTCRDIKSDEENCGGCGVRCPAGQTCQNGTCSGGSGLCQDGHEGAFCDLGTSEAKLCCGGGCVDTRTDTHNCGRCGGACLSDESCKSGRCGLSTCTGASDGRTCLTATGTGTCCNGACTDLSTDEVNCGQCGKGCGLGNECRGARCAFPSCTAGKGAGSTCFLGATAATGRCCGGNTCVDIATDEQNCLGCGVECAPGQTCQGGCK